MATDFADLTQYAKQFSGLTAEREALLLEIGPQIKPMLPAVTDAFYIQLQRIPNAKALLEGRIDSLKATHARWMETVFSGPYDQGFTESMYHVGIVHVRVKMPAEFMAGAMALIQIEMATAAAQIHATNGLKLGQVTQAISAVLGFCLMVMQQSYQEASLASELDKFLKITGMSRKLFDNLALAYKV